MSRRPRYSAACSHSPRRRAGRWICRARKTRGSTLGGMLVRTGNDRAPCLYRRHDSQQAGTIQSEQESGHTSGNLVWSGRAVSLIRRRTGLVTGHVRSGSSSQPFDCCCTRLSSWRPHSEVPVHAQGPLTAPRGALGKLHCDPRSSASFFSHSLRFLSWRIRKKSLWRTNTLACAAAARACSAGEGPTGTGAGNKVDWAWDERDEMAEAPVRKREKAVLAGPPPASFSLSLSASFSLASFAVEASFRFCFSSYSFLTLSISD